MLSPVAAKKRKNIVIFAKFETTTLSRFVHGRHIIFAKPLTVSKVVFFYEFVDFRLDKILQRKEKNV